MKDALAIHFKSKIGVQIQSAPMFSMPDYEMPTLTWAERQRDIFQWKQKCNIALRNRFLFWILLSPVCVSEAIGLLFLYGVLDNYVHGVVVGFFGAILIVEVWIISYVLLNEYFETDPYYICPKR